MPDGVEGQLDGSCVYDPPNLTYPFGAYICVVDVDRGTGQVKVRRFIAVDDCGPRINPMIVEEQVHGGLADGIGMALMEVIAFDDDGNCLGGSFMDYLLPTSMECPSWELGETVTPSPHHPLGVKGVGESATVGSPAAVVNAVIDTLEALRVRHVDMPLTPAQVWRAMQGRSFPDGPGHHVNGPADARSPFVRATVVGAASGGRGPSRGDSTVIDQDGTIVGFVGGSCVEASLPGAGPARHRDRGERGVAHHARRNGGRW